MTQPTLAFVHDTPAVRVVLRVGALSEVADEARKLGRQATVKRTVRALNWPKPLM